LIPRGIYKHRLLFFAIIRRRRTDVLILGEVSVTTAGVHGLTPPPPVL
jgi:acyl CoA:acetate/3-ketoacid CoA transferase beta subunit